MRMAADSIGVSDGDGSRNKECLKGHLPLLFVSIIISNILPCPILGSRNIN